MFIVDGVKITSVKSNSKYFDKSNSFIRSIPFFLFCEANILSNSSFFLKYDNFLSKYPYFLIAFFKSLSRSKLSIVENLTALKILS